MSKNVNNDVSMNPPIQTLISDREKRLQEEPESYPAKKLQRRSNIGFFNPAIPPQLEYLSRSVLRVTSITSITCDFPFFIPHPAVNFKAMPPVKLSKSRSRRNIFIPHPAIKSPSHPVPRLYFHSHPAPHQTYVRPSREGFGSCHAIMA